jgi:transposase
MSVPFLLTPARMEHIRPHFPRSRGIPRVDDRRGVGGISFVLKGGLRWRDAPPGYGPHKTLYNRFVR